MATPDWRQQVRESRKRQEQRRQEAGNQGAAPKSDAVEKYKQIHQAMVDYARSRGAWVISYAGLKEIRLEVPVDAADDVERELAKAGFPAQFESDTMRVSYEGLRKTRVYRVLA